MTTRERLYHYLIDSQSLLIILGFATYWAWTSSAVFSENLYRLSALPPDLVQFAQFFALCGGVMATIFAFLAGKRLITLFTVQPYPLVLSSATFVAIGFSIIAGFTESSIFLFAGTILTGIMMGLMLFPWTLLCVNDPGKRGVVWVAASISTGIALQFLIKGINPVATLILTALLPLVGALLLTARDKVAKSQRPTAQQGHTKEQTAPRCPEDNPQTSAIAATNSLKSPLEFSGLSWRLLLGLCIFSLVFSLASGLLYIDAASVEFIGQFQLVARFTVAALVCLGIVVFQWKQDILFKVGLLGLVAGLLILPFVPPQFSFLPGIILMGGDTLFELMIWAVLFEVIAVKQTEPIRTIGTARLAVGVGTFLGALFGILYKASSISTPTLSATIATATAYLVITVMVLILTENHVMGFWALIKPQPQASWSFEESCTAVAERYELSSRQQEIFLLLAQGRSTPFIAEKFVVSENTVNTHIRRIYAKLEIHTKQELIDLIDAERTRT